MIDGTETKVSSASSKAFSRAADEPEEGVELSYSNGPAVASTRWTR